MFNKNNYLNSRLVDLVDFLFFCFEMNINTCKNSICNTSNTFDTSNEMVPPKSKALCPSEWNTWTVVNKNGSSLVLDSRKYYQMLNVPCQVFEFFLNNEQTVKRWKEREFPVYYQYDYDFEYDDGIQHITDDSYNIWNLNAFDVYEVFLKMDCGSSFVLESYDVPCLKQ